MTNIQQIIDQIHGATFASIDYTSEQKLLGGKKNPFQGRVVKHVEGMSIQLGNDTNSNAYENKVNRGLEKQDGEEFDRFEVGARAWGTRIPNTPIISHKDNHYLQVIANSHPSRTYYTVDGVETDPSEIQGLNLNPRVEGNQGGLEDKVIVRTIKLKNIVELRAFNNTYSDLFYE